MRRMRQILLSLGCAAGMLMVAGCHSVDRLDRQVKDAVSRDAGGQVPLSSNTVTDAFLKMGDNSALSEGTDMDLATAVRVAARFNRSLQTKREKLYLSGLGALAADRKFGMQYSGTLEYVFQKQDDWSVGTTTMGLKSSRVLPTGGSLSAQAQSSALSYGGTSNAVGQSQTASSAGVELTQPLLAGAGYEASHEETIQAERDLVYGLRSYAMERQDFALGIMRSYYNLMIGKAVLENTRQNMQQAAFLRRRSEAMFKVRLAPAVDVMRSQQQELSASNALESAEADLDVNSSRFLLELGVPVKHRIRLKGEVPDVRTTDLDVDHCIRLALRRRLDLSTQQDQLEDARRRLRSARNALLPRFDAYGRAGATGSSTGGAADQDFSNEFSAGVRLELPLDKRNERDQVKKAELTLAAAERALAEKTDSIMIEILESFRRLKALELTAGIEQKNMDLARRRVDLAVLRFRSGELPNRDVVEAQNELLNAQNARVRAIVAYEQQRLQLLRNVGLLDVGPDGNLIELPAEEARKEGAR